MGKPGWYWVLKGGVWHCAYWDNGDWAFGESLYDDAAWDKIGSRIPTPDDVSWHEPTARQIREMCDGLTGNQIRWTLDGALKTAPRP